MTYQNKEKRTFHKQIMEYARLPWANTHIPDWSLLQECVCVCVYVRLRLCVMVGEGDIGMMSIIMTIKKWSLLQAVKLSTCTCTCAFLTVTRCLIYSVKGKSFCHSFLLSCVRHLDRLFDVQCRIPTAMPHFGLWTQTAFFCHRNSGH